MANLLPPGEPHYPPSLAVQAWGAPQWQQEWAEASQRWALGWVSVLQKKGGSLYHWDRYALRACLPGLRPWLENLTVRIYDQHHTPQPFAKGVGVDRANRHVWVERSWVERHADLPEDEWSRDSWHTQGWAEFWVRIALAMGAPKELGLQLLDVACRRTSWGKDTQKVLWPDPVVLGDQSPVRKSQRPDMLAKPEETLLRSQAETQGWELVRDSREAWSSEVTPWTGFARAARWMESTLPPLKRARQADCFLERAVRAEDRLSMSFWIQQVEPSLEKRLPGLLGRVRVADMVAPLVAKGADPNARISVDFEGHLSVLANAVIYAPSVVGALVSAGARWDTVPERIDIWENLASQLGQAYAWEWPDILDGLNRLPEVALGEHVPAKMVENFFRNHRFRTADREQAAQVLKSTLELILDVSPGLDLMPTLEVFVKASSPAYDRSLQLILDRLKGVDLNTVMVDGQDRLPIALVKRGAFAWDLKSPEWSRHAQMWECAGVLWKRKPGELMNENEATLSFLNRLRRPQAAREKSQALEKTLSQPFSSPPRPRL